MHPTLIRTLRRFGLLAAGRRVESRLRLRDVRALLPNAKLIVLLRDPVRRAIRYR